MFVLNSITNVISLLTGTFIRRTVMAGPEVDCKQSLIFFRFSKGVHERASVERRSRETRDARRETRETRAAAREEKRACQHFSFHAIKSLDRESPFSLALRVVSLLSCLSRLAPLVTRVVFAVSGVLLDGLRKKRDCS